MQYKDSLHERSREKSAHLDKETTQAAVYPTYVAEESWDEADGDVAILILSYSYLRQY